MTNLWLYGISAWAPPWPRIFSVSFFSRISCGICLARCTQRALCYKRRTARCKRQWAWALVCSDPFPRRWESRARLPVENRTFCLFLCSLFFVVCLVCVCFVYRFFLVSKFVRDIVVCRNLLGICGVLLDRKGVWENFVSKKCTNWKQMQTLRGDIMAFVSELRFATNRTVPIESFNCRVVRILDTFNSGLWKSFHGLSNRCFNWNFGNIL